MNWIKKTFNNFKNWIKTKHKKIINKIKSLDKEVKIALWISLGALIIVSLSTLFIYGYKDDFIKNVFVEAHGMVFDLLIIATFLFWLQTRVRKKRTREQNIKRWQEEIDDFRGWDEKEAAYKIAGNIKG